VRYVIPAVPFATRGASRSLISAHNRHNLNRALLALQPQGPFASCIYLDRPDALRLERPEIMKLRTHTLRGTLPILLLGAGTIVEAADSLTDLSLEELMNEPVTSVSKKQTRLGDSAAAIAVVTQEDIRRLGISSLPEALRLVPGMDVARISANEWAVSARGFNSEFANKLLVLIDGRTVYTPSSAGVFWNVQDVVLEDIDRIEVIRGPGATLWGANAVNGVINIITKHSAETSNGLFAASGGTEEKPLLTARYGAARGDALSFRVFGKYFSRDGLVGPPARTLQERGTPSTGDSGWTGRPRAQMQ